VRELEERIRDLECLLGRKTLELEILKDALDREVLAWTTSPRGIGTLALRDLRLLAVERRFGTLAAPQPVERLSDNGSCFTAYETIPSPMRSASCRAHAPPQSGVGRHRRDIRKTLKRDYVWLNPSPTRPPSWPCSTVGSRITTRCTRTAPSGCTHLASSSGRANPLLVPVDNGQTLPPPLTRTSLSCARREPCRGAAAYLRLPSKGNVARLLVKKRPC
jgi:hypothetical protein